ncbi:MAG: sugar transferase [Pseudomonadota bacterium]
MKKVTAPAGADRQSEVFDMPTDGTSGLTVDALLKQRPTGDVVRRTGGDARASVSIVELPEDADPHDNPGLGAKAALIGGILVAMALAAFLSAVIAGTGSEGPPSFGTVTTVTVVYALSTLLLLFSFHELASHKLADTPNRVIGVVEASILAWFPTLIVLLFVSQSIVGPLPLCVALLGPLAVTFNGTVTYVVTKRLTSTGSRIGIVLFDGAKASDAPSLPIGLQSISRTVRIINGGAERPSETIAEGIRDGVIDVVYIVAPARSAEAALSLVNELGMFDLPVWYAPAGGRRSQVMRLRSPMNSRIREAMKRGVDIVISLLALAAMLVPCMVAALLIWREDRGPIFFTQPRVGRNQVPFPMLKFRSMRHDLGDVKGDRLTTTNDDRVTNIGQFLRRTSVDELPQFINVLRGEMSIIGPRPLVVDFHFKGQEFAQLIPDFVYRSRVRPGVSGLSQLRGLRGTPDTFEEAMEMMRERTFYDNEYIQNWTIWMDLRIIVMTVLSGAFVSKAY